MMLVRTFALAGAVALASLGALSLAGCPPGLEDPESFLTSCPPDYSVESMLRDRCAGSGCHGGAAGDPAAGLDLVAAGAFERMFGTPSEACGGMLVSPLGADDSLLLHKLAGTSTCGARMPLGADPLTASDLACVRAWIAEGVDGGTPPSKDAGAAAEAGAGGAGGS